jgi:hypothetical protein
LLQDGLIYVYSKFPEIEKLVEKDKETPIDNLSTLVRIQRIQHMTLVWIFARAVEEYNEMLLKHQERCKSIVRQQLRISKHIQIHSPVQKDYCNTYYTTKSIHKNICFQTS